MLAVAWGVPRFGLLAMLASVMVLGGGFAFDGAEAQAPGGARPPTAVSVVTVQPEDIPIINELPGRIAPTRIAEVRPRISGIIVERVFQQGSLVKEGDVLYRIDPEPFKVQVDRAAATLKRAEAVRQLARLDADRQKDLRDRKVASAQQFDTAIAGLAQADADVASARAGLAAAQLDLEYAEVKAPISGRIGRALITEGALVSPTNSDALAMVQQLDPVYADFTQSANQLLRLRRALKAGTVTDAEQREAPVRLKLDDGSTYGFVGLLLLSEATVDATTGQVTLRAEFPNPDGDLLPNMYVRVVIEQGMRPNALAVPEQAVQRDTAGLARLYVVGDDNTAQLRQVELADVVDGRWVVTQGLNPGERVVVEGFQKIRPGAPVDPQPWKGEGAAQSGAAPSNKDKAG